MRQGRWKAGGLKAAACAAVLLLGPAGAGAQEDCKKTPAMDAERIVADCEAPSRQGWDSGIARDMLIATFDYGNCLQEAAVTHLHRVTSQSSTLQETRDRVAALEPPFAAYYEQLAHDLDACDPSCGAEAFLIAAMDMARLMEGLLRNVQYMECRGTL